MRGAGVTIFSAAATLVVQMAATMVLARMLAPQDFGLLTMVTTFSLLLTNFGLNGMTEAVIQKQDLDHRLASNLFWITVAMGLLLTGLFAASGTLLAHFYRNPLVAPIAAAMSLTIFFTSTSVLHLALLKRAMLFSITSVLDIVAAAVSLTVAIILAHAGWGYKSLVVSAIVAPLTQTIGAWIFCRWIPGLPRRAPGTGAVVNFAMHVYGRFGLNYGARNVDNLLVGWRFDALSLGFYKKAYDLFALSAGQIVAPLTNVAVSALSRLQDDPPRYKKYLLNALGVMAFVGMGLGANLTLVGRDVIRVLLGGGWDTAGQIFTFFGPGIGIMLLYYSHGWIHLSIGRPNRWLYWGFIEFFFTALMFLAALPWGPVGVAAAWTISFWILTIPAFSYAGQPIGLGVGPIVRAIWKYVLASAMAAGTTTVILHVLPHFGSRNSFGALERIVATSLLFSALYLAAVILLHRSTAPIYELIDLGQEMLPWSRRKYRDEPEPVLIKAAAAGPNGSERVPDQPSSKSGEIAPGEPVHARQERPAI